VAVASADAADFWFSNAILDVEPRMDDDYFALDPLSVPVPSVLTIAQPLSSNSFGH
jgi:hypothetical protein